METFNPSTMSESDMKFIFDYIIGGTQMNKEHKLFKFTQMNIFNKLKDKLRSIKESSNKEGYWFRRFLWVLDNTFYNHQPPFNYDIIDGFLEEYVEHEEMNMSESDLILHRRYCFMECIENSRDLKVAIDEAIFGKDYYLYDFEEESDELEYQKYKEAIIEQIYAINKAKRIYNNINKSINKTSYVR